MAELPLAPVERVMRNAGAERISLEAVKRAADEAELFIHDLARRAGIIARGDGRTTVSAKDVVLASKTAKAAEPYP